MEIVRCMVSILALLIAAAGAAWEYRRMADLLRRVETEEHKTHRVN